MDKCKTCIYYKPVQRELNYCHDIGFCMNPKFKFSITAGRIIGVFDKRNRRNHREIIGNPSHDFEVRENTPIRLSESRYVLQVSKDFGCIYHSKYLF